MLLSYGAKVNATNSGKKTALHYAASVGKKEVVELLLDHGAESWHRDEDGANALDLARAAGHSEVIPPLCKAEVLYFTSLNFRKLDRIYSWTSIYVLLYLRTIIFKHVTLNTYSYLIYDTILNLDNRYFT